MKIGAKMPLSSKFREKLHSLLLLGWNVQSWRLRRLGSGIPLDRQQKTCDGWSIWIVFGGCSPLTDSSNRHRPCGGLSTHRGEPVTFGGTDGYASLLLRHLRQGPDPGWYSQVCREDGGSCCHGSGSTDR